MANPQKENGHVDIANELTEAFQRLQLSGNQWRIIWVVLRQTYGWHKKTEKISLTTFEKYTGMERRNLKRNLDILVCREIIFRDNSNYITKYGLMKDYTKWQTGVKNDTSVKIDTTTGVKNDTKTGVSFDTHKRKKEMKEKYDPNSDEVRMSEILFSLIQKRNPGHKKPNIQEWAGSIDKMICFDNRRVDDIEAIIRWCQEERFWQNNILSTEKLRKQFDTLYLQADLNGNSRKRNEVVL